MRICTWKLSAAAVDFAATNSPAPWKSKLTPSKLVKCGQPLTMLIGGPGGGGGGSMVNSSAANVTADEMSPSVATIPNVFGSVFLSSAFNSMVTTALSDPASNVTGTSKSGVKSPVLTSSPGTVVPSDVLTQTVTACELSPSRVSVKVSDDVPLAMAGSTGVQSNGSSVMSVPPLPSEPKTKSPL